jgi:hypothetical protein
MHHFNKILSAKHTGKNAVKEGKIYDPFTNKMVPRKPIKVQAGGGATRHGVPVETGPSKYKEKLNKEKLKKLMSESRKAEIVKEIMKKKKSDKFESEPEINNTQSKSDQTV